MNFSSITFLYYFLPLVLALYYLVRSRSSRNLIILAASLIFYAWGEGYFILILLGSIAFNHWISHQIYPNQSKAWLALGIVGNLGLLIGFKYVGFLTETLAWTGISRVETHLPLGISFFTFQAMSLLVDTYRGTRPAKTVLKTGVYIAMFPQLIAGPIVRFNEIHEQIEDRKESFDRFATGVRIFILGLAQKVLIADVLAGPVDVAFSLSPQELGSAAAWMGVISFSFQIYFDFAGYSNMAIGLGHMLGFKLPQNFDYPYSARSFQEFWRRWHITLSRWFRDYLYIPLGGSRHGSAKTYRNLLIVFILCGIWHGAAWTFLLWGLWHGAFLVLERLLPQNVKAALHGRFIGQGYVFVFVTLGWVLFRAENWGHALNYWSAMLDIQRSGVSLSELGFYPSVWMTLLCAGLLSCDIFEKHLIKDDRFFARINPTVQAACLWGTLCGLFLLCYLFISANTHQPFLYFRF